MNVFLYYDFSKKVLVAKFPQGLYSKIKTNTIFKRNILRYVINDPKVLKNLSENIELDFDYVFFCQNLNYLKFTEIIEKFSLIKTLNLKVDNQLSSYIDEKNIYIQKRYTLGSDIKQKNFNEIQLKNNFEKFSSIVSDNLVRKLRDKQMLDSFFMFSMQKSANFSVPGSGKTSSALAMFQVLRIQEKCNTIIVISPINAFNSWIVEYQMCFGVSPKTLNIREIKNEKIAKQQILTNFFEFDLILVNYEAMPKYCEELSVALRGKTLLIFDEVHKVKKIGGKLANYALRISENAKFTIAMTGTPIPNSYVDIYNLLNILFPNEYSDFFGYDERMLENPDEDLVNDVNQKVYPFFCRTTKQELQVPPYNDDILKDVDATTKENRLFNIVLKKCQRNKLELFARILQLETNPKWLLEKLNFKDFEELAEVTDTGDDAIFVDFSTELSDFINNKELTYSSKFFTTIDYIKGLVENNKPVIVWCIMVKTIELFKQVLNEQNLLAQAVYGATPDQERVDIINNFKRGGFKVLITNPHTLAESVSLHTICHDAVYYEYSYNLVHLLQSKDRVHRLGLSPEQYTQFHYFANYFVTDSGLKYSMNKEVYDRLKQKEKIMTDAIDNDSIEIMPSSQEDLDFIFRIIWSK